MKNNKQVLNYCKNFEKIVNTDFVEGDNLSLQLVKIYKDYIFKIDLTNEDDIHNAIEIDKIMARYIDDYLFRKNIRHIRLSHPASLHFSPYLQRSFKA